MKAFAGGTANGAWQLYIVDDNNTDGGRGGELTGGWQLSIRTEPIISEIGPRTVLEDTVDRVPFNVGDPQPAGILPTATSSDTTLVPNEGLKITATGGATFLLEITPGANQPLPVPPAGTVRKTTITINMAVPTSPLPGSPTVSATPRSFELTVLPDDDAPLINGLAATYTTKAGTPAAPIPFTVSDVEGYPAQDIKVDAVSGNQSLVPNGNIVITSGPLAGDRTLIITPIGVETGTVTVTVTANDKKDGSGKKSSKSFDLVIDRTPAFANSTPITIVDNGTARPDYPSVIEVAGVAGLISKLTVTLDGIAHPYPDDLDILLTSADGSKKAMLLSDAGGGFSIVGKAARMTFDMACRRPGAGRDDPSKWKLETRKLWRGRGFTPG
ncbi:MAG: hypothetical protein IPM24_11395 [Bryobacterales bacterium]|nr:hypothetical protein [Bryobacterales bacterium]